ncbi:MAG: RidA family protein, partial [Treponema sp.]|nr:RidA family protein [Treponema sp.]
KEEAKYALENLKATIEAAGGTLADIVKVNVYVVDISLMREFNEVYKQYFPEDPPARIAMEIKGLSDGANLELDAIAVL